MAVVVMPIKPQKASYEFTMQLEKITYLFRVRFNYRMSRWTMDIATRDGVDLLSGIVLLNSVDLIGRFRIKGLPPGAFLIYDSTGKSKSPSFDDFGTTIQLHYIESEDIA